MRRDRYMDRLDFGGGAEYPSSGARRERKQKATLISVANSEAYNGYRKTISDGGNFSLPEGSEWPLAQFETSAGLVRVQLRPEMNEPLIPEELSEIARNMFERAKTFSDVEADVCDILMQNWLKDAKDAKHRAEIETDDLCRGAVSKPSSAVMGAGAVILRNSDGNT